MNRTGFEPLIYLFTWMTFSAWSNFTNITSLKFISWSETFSNVLKLFLTVERLQSGTNAFLFKIDYLIEL